MKLQIIFFVSALIFTQAAFAKGVPAQGRVFIGTNQVEPKDVNTELQTESLEEVETLTQTGAEVLFPVFKLLDVGLRYSKRNIVRREDPDSAVTNYQAEIDQDSVLAIARFSIFKTAIVRADVFAGYGGTNTTMTITTAAQIGSLERKDENGWFAGSMSAYGASVSVGYKMVYLFLEGGFESNKVSDFRRTGTVNGNINDIDLSGSYALIGLVFDGTSITKK